MPKEWNLYQPECTLAKFSIELVFTQSLQDNSKMLLMFFLILGVDQDVVNEYHDKLIQFRHEHKIHLVQEICGSIGKSKRHDQILIQPIPSRECSLRDVFRMDLDLMITRTKIYLGEDLCTDQLIKQDINTRKWILVLDGDNVQRPIIHIQS
jgi:hypothetical protein